MLKLENSDWRYEAPSNISNDVVDVLAELIRKIAGTEKTIIERLKRHFSTAAGEQYFPSSSLSWAQSDLHNHMTTAAANAPLFIEALYNAFINESLIDADLGWPSVSRINKILQSKDVPYQIEEIETGSIRPPLLYRTTGQPTPAPVIIVPPSFEDEAQGLIRESISKADSLFNQGDYRQAVQESLWLLETITTAFEGIEDKSGKNIQGKYFNSIIAELRKRKENPVLEQAAKWVLALHGFLSSPTGGLVRHGADIKNISNISRSEAHLYRSLISSYTNYLIDIYHDIKK